MVVIVNAFLSVDKTEIIYSVNGLRAHGAAGQALYRRCTDVGQKTWKQKKRSFCTSGPVDMQAVFHSRVGFQGDFVVLHASSCADRQRQQDAVSLWRRRMRFVLSADKTDVEQCLPHVETLPGETTIKKLRHRRRSCGHAGPALLFFLQTKGHLHRAGVIVSRRARTALLKLRQFSFFS